MKPLLANIVLDYLARGGPLMGPMVACLFAALFVVLERALWWYALRRRSDSAARDRVYAAIGAGQFEQALQQCESGRDPFLETIRQGLINGHTTPVGAMQLRATEELDRAEKRVWVLGTLITLAPLLGLLGTVTGIMGSFRFVGGDQLAPAKVSGGIAEALIATACGLGIAILCLLPYNFFNRNLARLRTQLERVINHTELLIASAQRHGASLEEFSTRRSVPASTAGTHDP